MPGRICKHNGGAKYGANNSHMLNSTGRLKVSTFITFTSVQAHLNVKSLIRMLYSYCNFTVGSLLYVLYISSV